LDSDIKIAELRGVSKSYSMGGGTIVALKDMSLTISKGEYIAVMGPSGSGKSTLLNLLGGVDSVSAGEIFLEDTRIDNLPETDLLNIRRKKIAHIFQEARLLSSLTAIENVMLPLAFYKTLGKGKSDALKVLEKVGLAARASHLPYQLSGGEALRVCIARALINDPSLVLADEPTGNLDSKTGNDIMGLFTELNSDGLTVLMVTHDPQKADYAGRIIRLKDGQIIEDTKDKKFMVCETRNAQKLAGGF
jgi:putative ABC transport system ATP-binding protein